MNSFILVIAVLYALPLHAETVEEIEIYKALDAEIADIKTEYPNINLDARDAFGIPLEGRLYEFMLENKIYCITKGFNLFLGENRPLPSYCGRWENGQ